MCLAKAYFEKGGEGELILEDVALLEVEGKTVRLSTIFGERQELEASVKQVDLNNSRILLVSGG